MRIGNGYDVHQLVAGRDLILGGIKIPHTVGLLGHSDADVLTHAIIDALIGAAGLGDIGRHFPDTDAQYKNCDSCLLLKEICRVLKQKEYEIVNIDSIIVAQKPKLAPYIPQMEEKLAKVMDISVEQINIKGKTEEKLGFTGTEEGMKAYAVCLIERKKS